MYAICKILIDFWLLAYLWIYTLPMERKNPPSGLFQTDRKWDKLWCLIWLEAPWRKWYFCCSPVVFWKKTTSWTILHRCDYNLWEFYWCKTVTKMRLWHFEEEILFIINHAKPTVTSLTWTKIPTYSFELDLSLSWDAIFITC